MTITSIPPHPIVNDGLESNFTMPQAFDIEPEFEKYFPIKIDLIPLESVYPEKREFIMSRSETLGP
jgi:hypothetical protein